MDFGQSPICARRLNCRYQRPEAALLSITFIRTLRMTADLKFANAFSAFDSSDSKHSLVNISLNTWYDVMREMNIATTGNDAQLEQSIKPNQINNNYLHGIRLDLALASHGRTRASSQLRNIPFLIRN